eukprot:gene19813-26497_t
MERDDNDGFVKVHKVETAGDCYIVSCGIMESDDKDGFAKVCTKHDPAKSASKVLDFAKDMLRISKMVNMPHDNKPVTIRIGIHTGLCCELESLAPSYPSSLCLGDTMNNGFQSLAPSWPRALRLETPMESTANHGGIQVSADTFNLLQSAGNTDSWKSTGGIELSAPMYCLMNCPNAILNLGRVLAALR